MSTVERLIILVALACGLLLLPRWSTQHPSHDELAELQAVLEEAQTEVDELRDQNDDLQAEILTLATNRRAIEKRARDEMLLAYPDELIFLFDSEESR